MAWHDGFAMHAIMEAGWVVSGRPALRAGLAPLVHLPAAH